MMSLLESTLLNNFTTCLSRGGSFHKDLLSRERRREGAESAQRFESHCTESLIIVFFTEVESIEENLANFILPHLIKEVV